MPNREIVIDPAFEGPPASGHGGYTCGLLAPYLPADAVALRLFPGPLAGRDLVAAVWCPGSDATSGGRIRPEFAWAALDCPGGWAAIRFGRVDRPAVLGRMAVRLPAPITAGSAHIVVGWLEGTSGRKLSAGSALYSRHGDLQGFSRQTWIALADPGRPA